MLMVYIAEHVFEMWFLPAFLESITSGSTQATTCAFRKAVFNTPIAATPFNGRTAAQALANAFSCYSQDGSGQCDDNGRVSELKVLRSNVNGMKNKVRP